MFTIRECRHWKIKQVTFLIVLIRFNMYITVHVVLDVIAHSVQLRFRMFDTINHWYWQTATEEKKRTKIVRVKNVLFNRNNRVLSHSAKDLEKADLIRIQFCFQKNDKRDIWIHIFGSGDKELCPVIAWSKVVKRVRRIKGSTENSEVCKFADLKGQVTLIRADTP